MAQLERWLRRLPALIFAAVLPLIIAKAWLWAMPPRYEATTTVTLVPAPRPEAGDRLSAIGVLATSRPVIDRLAAQPELGSDLAQARARNLAGRVTDIAARIAGYVPQNNDLSQGRLDMTARPVNGSMLALSVRSSDAASAARLANGLAEALAEEVALADERPAGAGADLALDALRQQLRSAEAALARLKAEVQGAPADRPAALAAATARARDSRALYERIMQGTQPGRDPIVLAENLRIPSIDRLKAGLLEAQAQEQSLRAAPVTRPAAIQDAQRRVQERRLLLTEALRLAATAAKADEQTAQDQVRALQQPGTEMPAMLDTGADVRLAEAARAVEEARRAYQARLGSTGATAGPALKIITPAEAPAAPLAPTPRMIWAIAGLASLLLTLWTLWRTPRLAPGLQPVRRATSPEPAPPLVDVPVAVPDSARRAAPVPPVEGNRIDAAGVPNPDDYEPAQAEILTLARDLSERGYSTALQTVLVTGNDAHHAAIAAIALATAASRYHLRILMIDADEKMASLSSVLHDAPISGIVPINGRPRLVATFEAGPNPVWFAPADSSITAAPRHAPQIVPGVAGHFDLIVIAGPDLGDSQLPALAKAADLVAVTDQTGSETTHAATLLGIDGAQVRRIGSEPVAVSPAPPAPPRETRTPPRMPSGLFRLDRV